MVKKLFNGAIELSSVPEIAKTLKVNPVTLLRYIRQGKMNARKIGRRYYITKENFLEFVNARKRH